MKKLIESATGRLRVDAILPSANTVETGSRAPGFVPRTPTGAPTDATDVSMLGAVRRMMVFAAEGAFDLLDGQHHSENLYYMEAVRREIAGKLAALPANDGNTDFNLLIRRGRDSFEKFSESVRREIIESIHPETGVELLDAALERVKNSAIKAGASLAMIERSISNI